MRLVSCKACRAQYDVTAYPKDQFACRCGARVEIPPVNAIHARIHSCSSCGASIDPKDSQCVYCQAFVERDHKRLTLACPECFTANHARARFCSGCGEPFRAQKVQEELTGKHCPDCGIELLRRELADQSIAECTHCNGIWVDQNSFEELVDHAVVREGAEEIRAFSATRSKPMLVSKEGGKGFAYRKCPDCGVMMHRKRFEQISDVVTDECAIHGVWLDAGELAAIARFVAKGGLARAHAHRARENAADAEHSVIITTYETDPDCFPELPEELFEGMDSECDGEIEQEIVIEYEDGSIEHRSRTIRPRDTDFKSIVRSFLDEEGY